MGLELGHFQHTYHFSKQFLHLDVTFIILNSISGSHVHTSYAHWQSWMQCAFDRRGTLFNYLKTVSLRKVNFSFHLLPFDELTI